MPSRIDGVRQKPGFVQSQETNQDAASAKATSTKPYIQNNEKSSTLSRIASLASLLAAIFVFEAGSKSSLVSDSPFKGITTAEKTDNILGDYYASEDIGSALRNIQGFEGREAYIRSLLGRMNPELLLTSSNPYYETALAAFNERTGLHLACWGIQKGSNDFIFINDFLGRNAEPVRIALTYNEVSNTRTKADVLNLLEEKLAGQRRELSEQYAVWARYQDGYDIPRDGSTACMVALALSNLPGMETDLVRAMEVYSRDYAMSIESICIDPAHKNGVDEGVRDRGLRDLPEYRSATRSEILREFERVLKKAIDEGKSTVMFHYMTHGGQNNQIYASDTTIDPREIAELIAQNYNGKPLCAQIDIVIWAGSCYSRMQLDRIKEYFDQHENIAVRNLRIISESKYTTAGASTRPDNASLVSDLMTDNSGPLDYYRSWYHEYLQYLQSKNIRPINPLGTYLHEVRFADLMSRFDTYNNQDAQGFHYYNDPETHMRSGRFFTNLRPVIVQNANNKPGLV
ncbi:MAG: caspase family protein [Candidatus Melainabacteria bacterium]|nr:caspase family protein [Candidatus Melainabacteria bacterium]